MLHCPDCHIAIALKSLLRAHAPGINFHRDAMRFRMTCPGCGKSIGFEPSATRKFFLLWLCPLPILAFLTHRLGFVEAHFVLALPLAWLLLFPPYWLGRARLAVLRSRPT